MAQVAATKLYNNFTKGLITEASPLTYPENACSDIDNCVLYIKGNVKKRFGFDFEEDYSYSSYSLTTAQLDVTAIQEYQWQNVNKLTNLNFLVLQVGLTLRFYDLATIPLSDGLKSSTVDLSTFLAPGADLDTATRTMVSLVGGRGQLFLAQKYLEPVQIIYTASTDTFSATEVIIQIRDTQGVDDALAVDEEPTSLSSLHNYNLQNQGWIASDNSSGTSTGRAFLTSGSVVTVRSYTVPPSTPINTYFTTIHRYPSNNKQWFVGKNGTTLAFDPNLLNKFAFGNSPAPKGHFVLDAFYKDRSAISGISSLTVESTTVRPSAVEFSSGRVWWLCQDIVYFSQVLDQKSTNVGACYQAADPTSETDPDLVATDGGVIPIHQLGDGVRLVPASGGMLVYGTLGVWYITGSAATPLIPGSGFAATDINVLQVAPIGTNYPWSVVVTNSGILWFSKAGIQAIDPNRIVATDIAQTSLSLATIQTFFNDNITEDVRLYVKAVYDPAANIVQWLFKTTDVTGLNVYNRILNFDLTLKAFYPWTIPDDTGCYITGLFIAPALNFVTSTIEVTDDSGDNIVTDTDQNVVVEAVSQETRTHLIKYVCLAPTSGNKFTFGQFDNTEYVDWESFDNDGVVFNAYLLAGFELLADAIHEKLSPWIFCYFTQTETSYVLTAGDYQLANPSSCKMRTRWEWSNTSTSNRWSREVEAYRLLRLPPVDLNNLTLTSGFSVIVTKNRVRGQGKALQFSFSNNTAGSGFDLLGWSVQYGALAST